MIWQLKKWSLIALGWQVDSALFLGQVQIRDKNRLNEAENQKPERNKKTAIDLI